jgi:hypothetical protein
MEVPPNELEVGKFYTVVDRLNEDTPPYKGEFLAFYKDETNADMGMVLMNNTFLNYIVLANVKFLSIVE